MEGRAGDAAWHVGPARGWVEQIAEEVAEVVVDLADVAAAAAAAEARLCWDAVVAEVEEGSCP